MFKIFKKQEKPWYEKGGYRKPYKHPISKTPWKPPIDDIHADKSKAESS